MTRLSPQGLLFGVLAGAACALLAGSLLTQTALAVLLFLGAALPVIAVGLWFGPSASAIAAVVAWGLATAFVSYAAGIVTLLAIALPAALATYLIALARPAEEIGGEAGSVVWFPLADVVLFCGLTVALGLIAMGAWFGYGQEFALSFAQQIEADFRAADPTFQPSADFAASLGAFIYRAVPLVQPAMLTLAVMANLYIALALVRSSGRLARPRDDWPAMMRMPKLALPIFGVALAASFLSGPVGLIGSVVCGAVGAGFLMAGLAIVHERTRGKAARGLMLSIAYALVFLFAPALFVFVIAGLFDTRRSAPMSAADDQPVS